MRQCFDTKKEPRVCRCVSRLLIYGNMPKGCVAATVCSPIIAFASPSIVKRRDRFWEISHEIKKDNADTRKRRQALSLEQMTGIGPAYSAWEADILPLNYICRFSTRKWENKNSAKRSFGANDGTRTHDLLITNQLLYQLSHISIVTPILPQQFLFVNRKNKNDF